MHGLADIKFDDRGLVPAIVQDADTNEILMMAWMNEESLQRTLEQGTTWFWSRCDGDVLLVKVHPDGPACHTGERTCFFRSLT